MVEGFCNCFSADFCFFSDFFAFLRSLRRLRAAARRFLRGRTAVFSTACSGASRQAAVSYTHLDVYKRQLGNLVVDIGLQQRHTHLAHSGLNVGLVQLALAAQLFENAIQALC